MSKTKSPSKSAPTDSKGKGQKSEINYIHKEAMHAEKIEKELKHFGKNVNKYFQLNPSNSYNFFFLLI